MRFLLDTHLLLWVLNDPERLSGATRDAIEDPANDILVSTQASGRLRSRPGITVIIFLIV
jgi:PIN domain nuclease of toxin-antitoxin system